MYDERETIIAETEAFAEVWNRGDAESAAAFFTVDGLRVGAFGDVQQGRDEIRAAYDRLLNQTMPGATVKQDTGNLQGLKNSGGLTINFKKDKTYVHSKRYFQP